MSKRQSRSVRSVLSSACLTQTIDSYFTVTKETFLEGIDCVGTSQFITDVLIKPFFFFVYPPSF